MNDNMSITGKVKRSRTQSRTKLKTKCATTSEWKATRTLNGTHRKPYTLQGHTVNLSLSCSLCVMLSQERSDTESLNFVHTLHITTVTVFIFTIISNSSLRVCGFL